MELGPCLVLGSTELGLRFGCSGLGLRVGVKVWR